MGLLAFLANGSSSMADEPVIRQVHGFLNLATMCTESTFLIGPYLGTDVIITSHSQPLLICTNYPNPAAKYVEDPKWHNDLD